MNIKNNNHQEPLVESIDMKAIKLVESYKRTGNKHEFLLENGNTIENTIIYNFIGLNETVNDSSERFTFENGMYIPGLGSKLSGRLSLNNLYESAKSEDDYVNSVVKEICEDKLMFQPTELDKQKLHESYKQAKKIML